MIELKRTRSPQYFETAVINHPEQTSTNCVIYTLTHNLGAMPDLTRMFAFKQLIDGGWFEQPDLHVLGTATMHRYNLQAQGATSNSVKVRIYRVDADGATGKLKFHFYCLT